MASDLAGIAAVLSPSPKCPCCGQAVATGRLLVDLTNNLVSLDGRHYRVNRRTAEFAYVIASAYPAEVGYEQLISRVLGINAGENCIKVIHAYACLARKALRPLGFDIKSTYGCGYRLVML